jgi:CRP/FNR family transcriptional regulator, cyclic AMP receptor protein
VSDGIEMQALRSTPFFSGLSPDDLEAILRVGHPVSFEAGSTIVAEGDPGDAMFIVVDGTAEVDVGGRFHRLTAGSFFGEMALIGSTKRMASVKAVEPVNALTIPAEEFRSFVLDHPQVALSMMRALVERLREVEQRIDAWMAN